MIQGPNETGNSKEPQLYKMEEVKEVTNYASNAGKVAELLLPPSSGCTKEKTLSANNSKQPTQHLIT